MNERHDPIATDSAQILRDRARRLARKLEEDVEPESQLEVLEFRLGQERYAVATRHVAGVAPLKHLTPLPSAPPFVLGIVSVRGRIMPVFDLKSIFGVPEQGLGDFHQIVIVEGNELEIGLLADATVGVHLLALESLQPPLPTLTGVRGEYLRGMTAERLALLDVERILADPKIIVHDEGEN